MFLLLAFITSQVSLAQSNECATATVLTPGATCVTTAGTNVGATQSIAPITCAGFTSSSALDVWYQFTATATAHTVTVVGGGLFDAIIDVRSGACNGTNIGCADATTAGGTEAVTVGGLTIGNVYLIRVYGWAGGTGTFTICVTGAAAAPANDNCTTATTLTSGTTCTSTAGSNVAATQSLAPITCAGFTSSSALDVWYQFTAVATTHTITVVGGGTFDAIIDVRSGACNGTNIACADATTSGGTEVATATGLTIGNTYRVRVYGWAGGTGTFTICVTHASSAPANDNCATATSLTSGTTCTTTAGTNASATQSIAPITCAGFTSSSALDVWYQFTAVATTHTVTVAGGAGFDAIIDVRSGACNGTNIACADATTSGGTEVATAAGLTIGNTYLIRVYGWAGGTGTFTICVTHVATPPANNDCANAVTLTPGTTCTPTAGTTVNATQSLAAITCASFTGTADDDVWYQFTATSTSHIVTVVGAAGFDAVVDVRSGACNGTNIGCADATVSGGTEVVTLTGLTIGNTYLVRVYSFGSLATNRGTFTICVTTPPACNCTITGANPVCAGATGISYSGPAGMTTYAWSISGNGTITSATNGQNVTVTAGAAGSYTLSLTTSNAGCTSNTCTFPVTVNPAPSATISYAGSPYCSNAGTASVTQTGTTGGTYSSTAGLTLNTTTGDVTLGTSTAGTYTVTYTIAAAGGCAVFTTTASITITALPAATINYAGSPYCSNAGTVSVAQTGTTGGTYSSTAGLTLNSTTGDVTTATSTAGTYTVTYTIAAAGGCPAITATANITIANLPVVTAPAVTQPTVATPTGTIVVNATGGPTLEYSVNGAGGPFQLSNTFSGLTPGSSYNIAVRLQNSTGCVVLYSGNPIIMNTISGRITDVLVGTSPFQDSMWTINLANYQIVRRLGPTLAGFTITGMNGIATNPLTGQHFMIAKVTGGRRLVKVNVQTGVCTDIGSLGAGNAGNFSTLAFKTNGELYGVTGDGATPPETMFKIDTLNGSSTLFRTLGNGADGEVIAFNPDDNFFYHWSGNGTVIWEKFATAVDPVQPLTTPQNGEVFGALYAGAGKMWVSSINSDIRLWDIPTQTASAVLINTPDDLRGLVKESCSSSLTAGGSTAICSGNSVLLSVIGGVSNYQWYLDGAPIGGANASSYSATAAGVYNCMYMDGCGIIDSVSAGITVTLAPTPDAIATPSSQAICSGSSITTIAITGSVGGTTFNWTRDNTGTVTGIASSGAGDIIGNLTNTTNAPVTVTFTITPTAGSCTGTPVTATVIVSPTPDVTQPANQAVCNNTSTAPVNFSGSVPGTIFNWTNNTPSIGLAASGTGDIASFTATNATTSPVVATVTVTPALGGPGAPTSITMPPQVSTNSPNVRGYWFTAPVNFNITSLFVPTDASAGNQSIAVVRFTGNTPPPVFSATTNAFTTLFLTQNDATPGNIAVNIPVSAGEVIGILGYRGTTSSYGNGSSGITIAGNPVATTRMGMQFPLTTTVPQNLWQEPSSTNISRVLFEYTTATSTCTGTPRTFTITVNPTPAATINYAGSPYCSNAGTATVTRTGTAGGTYSATPAGL
ncbi:MAG: PKD domain-containing protein, partial [Ferruginibacter sp.]|nr:PKD domain-containing protein [Ferruginibacter sp.]